MTDCGAKIKQKNVYHFYESHLFYLHIIHLAHHRRLVFLVIFAHADFYGQAGKYMHLGWEGIWILRLSGFQNSLVSDVPLRGNPPI